MTSTTPDRTRTDHLPTLPAGLNERLIAWRRDFHQHAETGWTEFRTTSAIIGVLRDLGWDTVFGPELHDDVSRLGVPDAEVLAGERERAVAQGADPELIETMGEGFTGVLGVLETGRPGPVVCFRFDIDSNDLVELADESHRPFASANAGAMHGCGHDGHAAIGLGLATTLSEHRDELSGIVKNIFQPAEEGVRGAHSIVAAGWFDDVDLFLATHLKSDDAKGNSVTGSDGYLASTKFDVTFTGIGSHAGGDPEKGKNALSAAASATLGLHSIPRHSGGARTVRSTTSCSPSACSPSSGWRWGRGVPGLARGVSALSEQSIPGSSRVASVHSGTTPDRWSGRVR